MYSVKKQCTLLELLSTVQRPNGSVRIQQWSASMSTNFENPANGYKEGVSSVAWLWCLLFGFIYFAVKGVWRHVLIYIVLTIITAGISWLIYPFFAKKIVENNYRRLGWQEV
jgi:hypothetical protein